MASTIGRRFQHGVLRADFARPFSSANPHNLSQKHSIVERQLKRKMKKGLDRLPSQGADPAAKFKHGWRLAAAAVLERYPVIMPEADEFELEYQRGRFLDQQSKQRPAPLEWFLSEKDRLEGRTEPTLDDPRAEMFEPAPRITEADTTNDVRSLERALDQKLYLVVKQSAKSKHWQFPQILATDPNVTMRDYTKQALNSVIPPKSRPRVHHMSYTPSCHMEHVFSPSYQEKHDVYGVKIFFYQIMLIKGAVSEVSQAVDFNWATLDELPTLLSPNYYNAVKPILVEVGPI